MLTTIEWHSFVGDRLSSSSIVIDLGANAGRFARKMRAKFDCDVIAVEPNPALIPLINPTGDPRLTVRSCAATGEAGTQLTFTVDDTNDLASRISSVDPFQPNAILVEGATLSQIVGWTARDFIDMVKIDIEGAEVSLIKNCDPVTLGKIGQLTIELHDFCGLISAAEVCEVKAHLKASGFFGFNLSRVGHQDTIFLNRRFYRIGMWQKFRMNVYKYSFGASRTFAKLLFGQRWHERFD